DTAGDRGKAGRRHPIRRGSSTKDGLRSFFVTPAASPRMAAFLPSQTRRREQNYKPITYLIQYQ
ncbi:MAG: hypothetical protein MJ000_10250, partial [Bacteroidales bacterium]|nr:hypothetical protein [Bacteroidales bacterium]